MLALLSTIWDFGMFTQAYIVTGELGNRDEFNLGIYAYSQGVHQPPHYGVASAAAIVLTIILLIITAGYVRATIKQGASHDVRPVRIAPKRLRAITRDGGRRSSTCSLVTLFPIFWMISTAFKPATEIYSLTPHPLPAHPTWSNFPNVINGSVIGMPYWTFLEQQPGRHALAVVVSSRSRCSPPSRWPGSGSGSAPRT